MINNVPDLSWFHDYLSGWLNIKRAASYVQNSYEM